MSNVMDFTNRFLPMTGDKLTDYQSIEAQEAKETAHGSIWSPGKMNCVTVPTASHPSLEITTNLASIYSESLYEDSPSCFPRSLENNYVVGRDWR